MKKLLAFLFVFIISYTYAQHTISGTFTPSNSYTWIIAYRLKPGTQYYVADTKIDAGEFTLNIPDDSPPGMYRLVYAVPQEEFYFDVLYSGKEDIILHYNPAEGLTFTSSQENILFGTYKVKIEELEQELLTFYTSQNTDKSAYEQLIASMRKTQDYFEMQSKELIAYDFIRSYAPYIPKSYESLEDYMKHKKQFFFNQVDFQNPMLQSSALLTDKIVSYVFTAVPLEQVSQEETEQVMLKNIRRVDYYIQRIDYTYKTHVYYNLWLQLAASGYNATSDFVFNTYLKDLALATDNIEIVSNIEIHNRLRIGAKAPEIIWNTNGVEASLSSLEGTNSYVLVFWSSTCSHCLNELPKLHGRLHAKKGVHVLAVGLEDEANYWQMESANLPEFTHAISKGKWESEAAKLYAINQTPTYFILDSEKRILAKPEDYKDVLNYLENMQTPRSQN